MKRMINIGEYDYNDILQQAVAEIRSGRAKTARQLNVALIGVYWNLGRMLVERKLDSKHGSGVVKRLASDLKHQFPDMGFSVRNMWYMKRFYLRFSAEDPKLQQAVALLPWGHIILLLEKGLDSRRTAFYAAETVSKGWSREMLLHAVKSDYYGSVVNTPKSNNFAETLPAPVAEYANEIFRSRYNLGFLGISEPMKELDMERRLVERVTRSILELGKGFTFIGNQYVISFNGKEYKVDMLFFHRGLHRMIAIDLKVGEFKPGYIGKMNFYLTLLDRMDKAPDEEPSIGLILCAEKDHLDVEVALQEIGKPIGVAEYQYLLPKDQIQQIVSAEMKKSEKQACNNDLNA